ncbi:hypothetical protein, partial [Phocaeicola dorei]
ATKNDMATSNRKRSRKSRGETIRSGLGNMKDLSVHRHKTAPVPAGGREEHQARKCIGCLGLKRQERYTV